MTKHYLFKPRAAGRNHYDGNWQAPAPQQIILPYTPDALATLLSAATTDNGQYSHHAIADWSSRFLSQMRYQETDELLLPIQAIVEDISVQWDLYLFNTYSQPQLSALDLTSVTLPTEWFLDWQTQLGQWQNNAIVQLLSQLHERYDDRYRPYGGNADEHSLAFRLSGIAATFSVISELSNGKVLYDIQIESYPPGEYLYNTLTNAEQLMILLQKYEQSPCNWP